MEMNKPNILNLSGDMIANFRVFTEDIKKYLIAMEAENKSTEVQLAILKNLMGTEALKLYYTLKNISDEQETVGYVLEVLKNYCIPTKTELTEMYRFFTRRQQADEPFKKYYTDLQNLIKACNFDNQEEKLLKLQTVIGIQNKAIKDKILKEDMCLQNIISFCESEELTQNQQILKQSDIISNGAIPTSKKQQNNLQTKDTSIHDTINSSESSFHDINCPTKGRECSPCKKPNHYIVSNCKLSQSNNNFKCIPGDVKIENIFHEENEDETKFSR